MTWVEVAAAPAGPPSRQSAALRALAPFAVAGALALVGLRAVAAAVAVVAVVLLVLTLVRPTIAHHLERLLAGFGRLVGGLLTTVLLGLVELLVFLPLSALTHLVRRDPIRGPGRHVAGGWSRRESSVAVNPRRPFGAEAAAGSGPRPVLRAAYLTVRVVGWVVIVLGLNYGLGWLWDEYVGSHDQAPAAATPADAVDRWAAAPAMASEPWADGYWDEFRALDYEFHPYLLSRVVEVEGRYINAAGPERRSYVPSGLGPDAPEVWFLGGAALWGQGQRDLHTVPSEVARLAEAAGTPIRAVNLGQPGYTSWQAALLLEQELAVRPAPDLVVFYDGAADVAVQLERPSQDPTHFNVEGVTSALTGRDSAREQARDWWDEYRETSVVSRALDRLEAVIGVQPAAADDGGTAERVADLHRRSVDLASFAAAQHGVDALFAWQAADGVPGDGGAYRRVARDEGRRPGGAVDLSTVLDDVDGPVYLDGVLTNERGAEVVAASLWDHIEPRLRRG